MFSWKRTFRCGVEATRGDVLVSVYGATGKGSEGDPLASVGDPGENPSAVGGYKGELGFKGDRNDGEVDYVGN